MSWYGILESLAQLMHRNPSNNQASSKRIRQWQEEKVLFVVPLCSRGMKNGGG